MPKPEKYLIHDAQREKQAAAPLNWTLPSTTSSHQAMLNVYHFSDRSCKMYFCKLGKRREFPLLPLQAQRLLRKLFFISCNSGCRLAPPMRRATQVAKMSMIIRCSRRDTMGL